MGEWLDVEKDVYCNVELCWLQVCFCIVYVVVQGDRCVFEIFVVFFWFDVDFEVDVIIIVCGGGDLQMFLGFSDECFVCVVVVVFILVVSVIGYENDYLLFDDVVDLCVLMLMDVVKCVVFDVGEQCVFIVQLWFCVMM